ncbi:NAD(P)-binding protein [Lindgomyces ingoldianus]|uniref:NAD(P)-binding protein n=1 Tax=Lindgomyces ingoldianus TaxID=673940 RepID=A0ACB6QPA1_9PLEO|nr:NAD(P)-binding protein [Lindgomyces ingoldianus]KAF2468705.1 NAD(P)-binding protein [Lindgomyces ingoldianus]
MPIVSGFVNFNPNSDIPSLSGRVIFITGGTAGIGLETVKLLAVHNPGHIYFSGRNARSGNALIEEIRNKHPDVGITFVDMDLSSMESISAALKSFVHDRLDTLINNAGIMAQPPALSKDGYEIQFATNHLGHALLTKLLLPTMLKTAALPDSDVRIVNLTSVGYRGHPLNGISFDELDTSMNRPILGPWIRYAQSKLANILYASELSRRYPNLTSVSVHPGVVATELVTKQTFLNRVMIYVPNWLMGVRILEPEKGAYSQVWCAVGARKEEVRNGAFYMPIGAESTGRLDGVARNKELAGRLWEWTEKVLKEKRGAST